MRGPLATCDFIAVIPFRIEQLPLALKREVQQFLRERPLSPAAKLRPIIAMTVDSWLVFVGPRLCEAAAGMGQTPIEALEDFNRRFTEPIESKNGSDTVGVWAS